MSKRNVLIVDFYNQMHRARGGPGIGPSPIVFQFFRSLRSSIEKLKADKIIIVSEGVPKKRIELYSEYKANRKINENDVKKQKEMEFFRSQKLICENLLKECFPVQFIRHPNYEADDVIYTVISKMTRPTFDNVTVLSNDSDFIQLLNEFSHVKVFNPIKKEYFVKPDYDYVMWKSLRGDDADNIKGVYTTSKRDELASKALEDPTILTDLFSDQKNVEIYTKNLDLIKLKLLSDKEINELEISKSISNWEKVKEVFTSYKFKSMINDDSWIKFINTFEGTLNRKDLND